MRYLAIGVYLALFCVAVPAVAADEPAFTGTGATCADLTWQPSVLERFPNIGIVCQAVVERDGKLYAQFNGVVQRRSGNSLYIRFAGGEQVPGGDRAVLIKPPSDMKFRADNRTYRVRDAQRGQDLTIFIPSDRFAVNLGDEVALAEQTEIAEVVPLTEEPAPVVETSLEAVEETPASAPEPAQVAEATPPPAPDETPVLTGTPAPEPVVTAAPVPPPAETPWLLIALVAIVIVVGVILFMRRRGQSK